MTRIALALVLVAGCFGRSTLKDPHEGQLKLTVHNHVGGDICAVHLFPIGETNEGASWLRAGSVLSSGRSVPLWVPKSDPPDTYQFHAIGCPYEPRKVSGYAPAIIMNGPATVVIYDESEPRSKQTAGELAHANENTTSIPAKITRNASPSPRPAATEPAPPPR